MESLLIYVLKSAGLLSIFYMLYILLLKNDTSFSANRKFLLGGIFSSIVLPSVYFTKKVLVNAPEIFYNSSPNSNYMLVSETTPQGMDWWMIAGSIYLIITGFFLLRFCFRIFQILKMIRFSEIQKKGKYKLVETNDTSGPFSFFNYIFINPKNIKKDELQLMLTHEKVHARQLHSIDMILSNFITALLWFNPISWFYQKIIEQNLEFIADSKTAQTSECIQHYQHVLVKVSTKIHQPALVNHFYQSFIKKRILMLNKKTSNRSNLSKMGLIFPILLAFMLTFNVKTEAQVIQKTKVVLNDVQFYPDELASAIVTKNSTKAELDDFSRKFKEQGVELQFKKLKYSKEGLLTRIHIKYEIERTGASGNFNKDSDAAIDDIDISLTEDFNIEFRSSQTKNEKHEFVVIRDSNSVPIGSIAMPKKRIWKTNLEDVTIERVMYTTPSKTTSKGMFSVGNKVQYYATDGDPISGKGQIRNVKTQNGNRITWTDSETDTIKHKYRVIVIDSAHTNASNISKNVRMISRERNGKPLFIVNGEVENNDFHSESIDPDNIENIYVLKDATAIKKYGSKGKNGVIEINTKSNALFRIKATTSDAEIEDLKRTIAAKSDFKLSLTSLERNKKGLISTLNIKFSSDSGKMVSGNYSDIDGIADIYFGEKEGGGLIIYSN